MQQRVHIPLIVQIIDAMFETGTTAKEIAQAVDIREATISNYLTGKTEMMAGNIDRIFTYLMSK